VIHIHDFRSFQGIVAAYAALRSGVPYVIQAHGSIFGDRPPLLRGLLRTTTDHTLGYRVIRKASQDVALSEAEVQQYLAINVSPEKIFVVPNGIDPLEYSVLPASGIFRSRFNIPERTQIVLYLGRIAWSKGLDFLVAGFGRMIRNNRKMDVIMILAGPNDGYLSDVRRLVDSLGIGGVVRIVDKLSEEEKVSAYVDASVVVNVEPRNVFGLVPLEAAACSRPVIVSNGNAIRNLVLKEGLGCAVEYGNTEEFSQTLKTILDSDGADKYVRSRDIIMKEYTWGNTVDRLLSMYSRLS
jgi:glycosyltransferase involved in cell wall biosynthesis